MNVKQKNERSVLPYLYFGLFVVIVGYGIYNKYGIETPVVKVKPSTPLVKVPVVDNNVSTKVTHVTDDTNQSKKVNHTINISSSNQSGGQTAYEIKN